MYLFNLQYYTSSVSNIHVKSSLVMQFFKDPSSSERLVLQNLYFAEIFISLLFHYLPLSPTNMLPHGSSVLTNYWAWRLTTGHWQQQLGSWHVKLGFHMRFVWFHMNVCSHAFSVSHAKNMAIQQKYRMDSKEEKNNRCVCVRVCGREGQLLPQLLLKQFIVATACQKCQIFSCQEHG